MKYIIYARKSSESEDRQALSIQSQIIEMQEVAKKYDLEVVEIFQESKSAKAPGRPIFDRMLEFIKTGKAQGILCWKIDRLARNPVDEGLIKWMLQNKVIQQIKTYDRDYNPEDNVVIASIEFGMANQYIRDLSRNVKRGQAEKIRLGEYPGGYVPLGYTRNNKTRKIQLDRKNWHYIKEIFQLYATGLYSIRSLTEKFYEKGLRSKTKKEIGTSSIHRILTNPFYYGWFKWGDKLHKGIHAPIVSKKMFDDIQEIMFPKARHNVTPRNFIFRGVLTCGECGLSITAETQKGHHYYRCTKSKGSKKCSQKYLREEKLAIQISKELKKLKFDSKTLDLTVQATKEKEQKNFNFHEEERKRNQELLTRNKRLQESLVDKFIEEKISEKIYDNKLAKYKDEEATLEDFINRDKDKCENVIEKMEMIAKFTKLANTIFINGTDEIKKEVVSIIASNIVIKDQKITNFSLKEPFVWLLKNDITSSSPKTVFEPASFAFIKTKTATQKVTASSMFGDRDSNPN